MSIRKHTTYNLAGAIVPALLMLVSVPLYFGLIGEARYGVLAIVWLLTGSFGFFDFGLGRATAYAISSKGDATREEREKIFWTAIIVNCGFGVLGALVMLLVATPLFTHVFNISDALMVELRPVLPWLSLAIPMLTLEGVLTGALTGREKFLALNIRAIFGACVTQLLPLGLVWALAPTLTIAVVATLIARAINVSFFLVVAFKAVPASLRPRWGGLALTRELTGYGGWISLSAFLDPLVAAFDRFVIATFLNPLAVAFYVVPYQLVTRGGLFSRALGNALFPRLANLDPEKMRELTYKAIRANAALMLVLCSSGMIIMKPFLTLWIDEEFSQAASRVGEQLVITVWLTAISVILLNMIQAQGRPKETVKILLFQVPPFIILGLLGVQFIGVLGVALARNFRSILNLFLMARSAGFVREVLGLIAVPMSVLIALSFALNLDQVSPLPRWGLVGAIWTVGLIYADRTFPEARSTVIGLMRARFT